MVKIHRSRQDLVRFSRSATWVGFAVGWLCLAACTPAARPPTAVSEPPPTLVSEATLVNTPTLPQPTITSEPTRTATPEQRMPICSPFPGYSYAGLQEAISNPFNPPPLGSDDPHHGVDLAIEQFGIAISGGAVQAVLAGQVALVIEDLFPYGNAILIETGLDQLPQTWIESNYFAEAAPTPAVRSALTCPEMDQAPYPPGAGQSLYILYAHLATRPAFEVDDQVSCGTLLGQVGQSGNALNPHLHLEARFGPAQTRFEQLGHYTTRASPLAMRNYCLWRVSGVYRMIDPLRILETLP